MTPTILTRRPATLDQRLAMAWFVASAMFALGGMFSSAALLVDYVRPTPLFCADGGGCSAIRDSGIGWLGPIPLPAIGLIGYVIVATTLLIRGPKARAAHLVTAGMGGTVAAVLIATQIRMGVFCKYCMVVDVAMLALLGLATLRSRRELDRPLSPMFVAIPAGAYFSAVAAPIAWGVLAVRGDTSKLPLVVREEMGKTPHEQVCVVDFVDYECPFCRQTHADFQPTLDAHKGRLRVVRKNVPLTSIHPHAMIAARASCCADDLGQGDAMAAALMTTPPEQFTDETCAAMATRLGLDPQKFRACMDDPATAQRIDADVTAFRVQGGHGLPTIWIDDRRIEGAQGPSVLRHAVERALDAHGS